MANRIIAAIERQEQRIKENTIKNNLTPERLEKCRKDLDMQFDEYCQFQTMKSAAMYGKLTPDEAQTIYGYLGESVETFNGQSLAVKAVLTKVFAELLSAHISARQSARA